MQAVYYIYCLWYSQSHADGAAGRILPIGTASLIASECRSVPLHSSLATALASRRGTTSWRGLSGPRSSRAPPH